MSKFSQQFEALIIAALKTFPERMTRKELIKECQRHVLTEPLIWVTPETFAGHVMRHADCSYNRKTKVFMNYQVKDLKGKLRLH